jgi:hypothetical protein
MAETSTAHGSPSSEGRSTLTNGVIGGAVGIVLFFLPFSPLLGGAVAGYLETEDGAALKAGAVSGLVALVPLFLFGLFALLFILGFGPFSLALIAVFAFLLVAAYTVGLGALGGLLGAYLEDEL